MMKTNIGEMPKEDYESTMLEQYLSENNETERNNPMEIEEKPKNSEKKTSKEIKAEKKEKKYSQHLEDATDLAGSLELVDNGLDYNDANAVIDTIKQQGQVKYKSFITSLLLSGFKRRAEKKESKLKAKIVKYNYKVRRNKVEISKRNGKINLANHEIQELQNKCANLERQNDLFSIIGGNKSYMVARLENINAMKIQKTLSKIDDLKQYIRGQYDEIKVFNANIVDCYSDITSCKEQISEIKKKNNNVQLLANQSASNAILHFLVANKLGMEVSELFESFDKMEKYNEELFAQNKTEDKVEVKSEQKNIIEPSEEKNINENVSYMEMSLQEALEVKENGIEYLSVKKVDNKTAIVQLDSSQKEIAECILDEIRSNTIGQTL